MIYLHIPFCKQACHYCDFHFSTNLKFKRAYIDALLKEIDLQKDFFTEKKPLETIYFGGGTPSLLTPSELGEILTTLKNSFEIQSEAEITLEANPDDLTLLVYLQELRALGINRLSIGIQSFDEDNLRFMNRAHNAIEAQNCVALAQQAGFENISIDLIYGVQTENVRNSVDPHQIWQSDLEKALALNVTHISSYCLTIEPKTTFGNWLKKGKLEEIDDAFAAEQFEILMETLAKNGFVHYEISNFGKPYAFSRHNTAYWQDKAYLGLGASAHSYNGEHRFINIANNRTYIESLSENKLAQTIDKLTLKDRINEYFLTSLRTIWGIDLTHLQIKYNYDLLIEQTQIIQELVQKEWISIQENRLILTQKGKFFADGIATDLFLD